MTAAHRASRLVSDHGQDDVVLPFAVEALDARGRIVRFGATVNKILSQHEYPPPVARLVGEAVVLTSLLGTALKLEGRFQLQTKSDGIVDMLVVDFEAPDKIRAFARFDAGKLATALDAGEATPARLLGSGHLALTIDRGGDMSRYQGVVALEGQGLVAAAHEYFRQSEQIPTLVKIAVAENVTGAGTSWRAGGLIVQFLPAASDRLKQNDLPPGDLPEGVTLSAPQEDDAWAEARALADTIEDHELVDPMVSSERLLYRLYHERGVRVFEGQDVHQACRCSRERIEAMLRSFSPKERADMVGEDGKIGVTCEFCSVHREFDPASFDDSEET